MHHNPDLVQVAYVGDQLQQCRLALFSDASFSGDLSDSKSTTGGYVCLVGAKTFVPLTWICKKQGAASHSSSEAEVVSLEAGAGIEGILTLMLWEVILDIFHPNLLPKTPGKNAGGDPTPAKTNIYQILVSDSADILFAKEHIYYDTSLLP